MIHYRSYHLNVKVFVLDGIQSLAGIFVVSDIGYLVDFLHDSCSPIFLLHFAHPCEHKRVSHYYLCTILTRFIVGITQSDLLNKKSFLLSNEVLLVGYFPISINFSVMKKCKHSNGTSKESAKVKPIIVANATTENGYFTRCELQEFSLQRYAADFEYLRRVTTAPGEPKQFNWTHGCIRARANALLAMLAKNPANHDMRKMYEDYRSLENEVFGFANQPPYNFSEEPSDADNKLKEVEAIPEIQISFDNATQFFSL